MPHRAHVPRRPAADRAAHDPRRRRRTRRAPRSRSCATLQRADFVGHPRGDGRPAGHRPAARPAAARVPPRHRRAARARKRTATLDRRRSASCSRVGAVLARGQPDARHARRAGSASSSPASTACRCGRSSRPRSRASSAGGNPIVEIMIPLIVTEPELALLEQWVREEARRRSSRDARRRRRLPRRHDDRDAARRARRRRDRRGRRVLLVRHQRPHADDVRVLAATTSRAGSCPSTSSTSCCRATRSRRSTSRASASSCAWASSAVARRARPQARHLRRARRRSRVGRSSATRSASTTCRARRTACRSPASPPRTPRWGRRPRHHRVTAAASRPPADITEFLNEVFPGAMEAFAIEAVGPMTRARAHALPRLSLAAGRHDQRTVVDDARRHGDVGRVARDDRARTVERHVAPRHRLPAQARTGRRDRSRDVAQGRRSGSRSATCSCIPTAKPQPCARSSVTYAIPTHRLDPPVD